MEESNSKSFLELMDIEKEEKDGDSDWSIESDDRTELTAFQWSGQRKIPTKTVHLSPNIEAIVDTRQVCTCPVCGRYYNRFGQVWRDKWSRDYEERWYPVLDEFMTLDEELILKDHRVTFSVVQCKLCREPGTEQITQGKGFPKTHIHYIDHAL